MVRTRTRWGLLILTIPPPRELWVVVISDLQGQGVFFLIEPPPPPPPPPPAAASLGLLVFLGGGETSHANSNHVEFVNRDFHFTARNRHILRGGVRRGCSKEKKREMVCFMGNRTPFPFLSNPAVHSLKKKTTPPKLAFLFSREPGDRSTGSWRTDEKMGVERVKVEGDRERVWMGEK